MSVGGRGLMGKQSCGGQNIIGEWKDNDMGAVVVMKLWGS